jgi:hypothetical protein
VTLTRDRPQQLRRAVASVAAQSGVTVEHLVIGDDCSSLASERTRRRLRGLSDAIVIHNVQRTARSPAYTPARLSSLRNAAARLASGDYISQLDDDNEYEEHHLHSLVALLERSPGIEAAHSWRRLFYADGRPFLIGAVDPWNPNARLQQESYRELCRLGVLRPGSNVVRDTIHGQGAVIPRVDTSEWLLSRALQLSMPWPERFNRGQVRLRYSEDMLFTQQLRRAGVATACSGEPTLRYYMGGYSTADALGA